MVAEYIAKGGLAIVRRIIPPLDGDPWERFKYDLMMSAIVFAGGITMMFHVMWVCGWLAFIGLVSPYASAATAENMQAQVNAQQIILISIQAGQINDKIRAAKTQVCLAIQAKNQTALDAWARELENQKQQYRDKIQHEPSVMGCDELLIGGTTQ